VSIHGITYYIHKVYPSWNIGYDVEYFLDGYCKGLTPGISQKTKVSTP